MTSFLETGTILDRILARTMQDLAVRKVSTPRSVLERMATDRPTPVSLKDAVKTSELSVIAEYKRASPSKGRFPFEAAPSKVAAQYFDGGAAAMSVLTDEPFFQGSLEDMQAASAVAHAQPMPKPVLRKDFVFDEFQILEALAYGADAVLLIVAALDQLTLIALIQAAAANGLDALVEIHDADELQRALDAGSELIGINNRDLRTFTVDLSVTERLAGPASGSAAVVSESGIFTTDDVQRVRAAGADAILVGESLITAIDRAQAVRMLLNGSNAMDGA